MVNPASDSELVKIFAEVSRSNTLEPRGAAQALMYVSLEPCLCFVCTARRGRLGPRDSGRAAHSARQEGRDKRRRQGVLKPEFHTARTALPRAIRTLIACASVALIFSRKCSSNSTSIPTAESPSVLHQSAARVMPLHTIRLVQIPQNGLFCFHSAGRSSSVK